MIRSGLFLGAGQFGEIAGRFYPGGRKVFMPNFGCFLGFVVLSGVCCRLVEVVQNVETGFPLSVCVVLCLVSVRLCVIWGGRKCWVGWISPLGV